MGKRSLPPSASSNREVYVVREKQGKTTTSVLGGERHKVRHATWEKTTDVGQRGCGTGRGRRSLAAGRRA